MNFSVEILVASLKQLWKEVKWMLHSGTCEKIHNVLSSISSLNSTTPIHLFPSPNHTTWKNMENILKNFRKNFESEGKVCGEMEHCNKIIF